MILAIDTSCDETAAAVVSGTRVVSNIIWSQATLHAKWGGVFPSAAKRAHEERIDWVVDKAMKGIDPKELKAVAVTVGPGLAIALEVGITKAKQLALKYALPLIPVNHVEGHLLSPLASSSQSTDQILADFPILCFVASGGTTQLILTKAIGDYDIVAQTSDDALGEALDKAARMLGLGYPGGALLEQMAKLGSTNTYPLPVPMVGKEDRLQFSFSGLKTAMYRLVGQQGSLTKTSIYNLSAVFQDRAFKHTEKLIIKSLETYPVRQLWFSGGVAANTELRRRIRRICRAFSVSFKTPYSKKLCGDNGAMIGIAAGFKLNHGYFVAANNYDVVDRVPRARVDQLFPWEKPRAI